MHVLLFYRCVLFLWRQRPKIHVSRVNQGNSQHKSWELGVQNNAFLPSSKLSVLGHLIYIYLYIYIYIYSFSSLSHDRSKASSKSTSSQMRSRASSFRCEYPLPSLRSSSSFLRFLPRLLVTSIPPFIFPSITCCGRQFLRSMLPIQLAFRLFISCRIFLCSFTLICLHFSRTRSNWSYPSFSRYI
jgi:hypothetical protein